MSLSLQAQRLTILHTNDTHSHIDPVRAGAEAGLGGVNSWSMGGTALSQYRLPYADRSFTFVLRPVAPAK